MGDFSKIYVSWRSGRGKRRHLVGLLEKVTDKYQFTYNSSAVAKATSDGFTPFIELPDIEKKYDGYALQIFSQRLMKPERPDIQQFYDFWEVRKGWEHDSFYLLGQTQGLLPTDNFEFLAEHKYYPGLCFLTELASISHNEIDPSRIKVGDNFSVQLEPENEFDKFAVRVFFEGCFIGYIKQIHSRLFYSVNTDKLSLTVKAVDKNGVVKRLFIKVQAL